MAPEGPSDIYSLGCILRELRLGWLSQIGIRKCCARRNQRYADIAAIQRDLHRCWRWPQRLFLAVGIAILVIALYLVNLSQTQQKLQTVSDSLKVFKEENNTIISSEQAKSDSLQLQINHLNKQTHAEQAAAHQHQRQVDAAKKQIDKQLQAYGIQQMLDTVSCQRNITIPFLRITDELIRDTKEPELKEYIQERYRKPWIKRMTELPFE